MVVLTIEVVSGANKRLKSGSGCYIKQLQNLVFYGSGLTERLTNIHNGKVIISPPSSSGIGCKGK